MAKGSVKVVIYLGLGLHLDVVEFAGECREFFRPFQCLVLLPWFASPLPA